MNQPNVHAVHRDWDRPFPLIQRTEGIYLYDEEGRKFIDVVENRADHTSVLDGGRLGPTHRFRR